MGSRALAILSCALALLAVQPLGSAAAMARAAAPNIQKLGPGHSCDLTEAPASLARRTAGRQATGDATRLSTRRLHILATVDILKRLLAFELQPPRSALCPAFLCPPLLVEGFDLPPARPQAHPGRDPPLLLMRERSFLLTQTLLAPPVA